VVNEQTWAMMSLDATILWSNEPDIPLYAASLIKVPLAMAVLQLVDEGSIALDTPVVVRSSASATDESPITIDHDSIDPYLAAKSGAAVPLSCLLERSIVVSSNEATNLLIDLVEFDRVNEVLAAVGAAASAVQRRIFDSKAGAAGFTNIATASDMARLMAALYRGDLLTVNSTAYLRSLLLAQQDRVGIPAGSPNVGLNGGVVGGLVGNKTGSTSTVAHDIAFVEPVDARPYVLAVLTSGAALEDPGVATTIAEIATRAYEMRQR
jgi:beta-lactamase class A